MAQSPISAASKVKAPTLILHDTGDYRVAITESFEWFHGLRANGVTVEPKIAEEANGRFAWVVDPEGNKIELWEPKEGN